jgi:hypothetical protein
MISEWLEGFRANPHTRPLPFSFLALGEPVRTAAGALFLPAVHVVIRTAGVAEHLAVSIGQHVLVFIAVADPLLSVVSINDFPRAANGGGLVKELFDTASARHSFLHRVIIMD